MKLEIEKLVSQVIQTTAKTIVAEMLDNLPKLQTIYFRELLRRSEAGDVITETVCTEAAEVSVNQWIESLTIERKGRNEKNITIGRAQFVSSDGDSDY